MNCCTFQNIAESPNRAELWVCLPKRPLQLPIVLKANFVKISWQQSAPLHESEPRLRTGFAFREFTTAKFNRRIFCKFRYVNVRQTLRNFERFEKRKLRGEAKLWKDAYLVG